MAENIYDGVERRREGSRQVSLEDLRWLTDWGDKKIERIKEEGKAILQLPEDPLTPTGELIDRTIEMAELKGKRELLQELITLMADNVAFPVPRFIQVDEEGSNPPIHEEQPSNPQE